jgi:hypothetical protein
MSDDSSTTLQKDMITAALGEWLRLKRLSQIFFNISTKQRTLRPSYSK